MECVSSSLFVRVERGVDVFTDVAEAPNRRSLYCALPVTGRSENLYCVPAERVTA